MVITFRYRRPFWQSMGWVAPERGAWWCVFGGPALAIGLSVLGVVLRTPAIPTPVEGLISGRGSLWLVAFFAVVLGPRIRGTAVSRVPAAVAAARAGRVARHSAGGDRICTSARPGIPVVLAAAAGGRTGGRGFRIRALQDRLHRGGRAAAWRLQPHVLRGIPDSVPVSSHGLPRSRKAGECHARLGQRPRTSGAVSARSSSSRLSLRRVRRRTQIVAAMAGMAHEFGHAFGQRADHVRSDPRCRSCP